MSDILGMSDLRTIHEEEEEETAFRRNSMSQGYTNGRGVPGHAHNGASGGSFDGQIDPELLESEDGRRGFPRVSISMTPQRQLGDLHMTDDRAHAGYDQTNLSRLVRMDGGQVGAGLATNGSGAMWQQATLAGMEQDGSESYHDNEEEDEYDHERSRRKGARRSMGSMGEEGSGEDVSGAEGTGRKRAKVDSKTCDNCRKRKVSRFCAAQRCGAIARCSNALWNAHADVRSNARRRRG